MPVGTMPGGVAPGTASGAAQTGASGAATPSGASSAASRLRDSIARIAPPVASDEDLARTVVSVFGDSAALRVDSTASADEVPLWDLDVRSYETHDRVAHYVRLFSTDGRDRFAARLSRGSRYEPMIREKLRANGMPEDLTYLALIESGYDPHAYSRAAAVGMWQFMSGTARGVGMRVDWWMDERRDPARATDGAIRFLGDLQKQFGSLYLAAAAYNGGPGRVARGLTRFAGEMEGSEGEDRFFALAEQDYLRAETKNYVPQLIAAALVAKTPIRYGIVIDSVAPYAYDSVRAPAGTSLSVVAEAVGATSAEMRDLNPAILRGIVPPDAAVWVRIPTGTAERAAAYMDTMPTGEALGYRTVRVAGASTTPTALAKREGVTLKQLRWFNPALRTSKSGRLVSGQSVRIPSASVFAYARDVPDPAIERYGGGSGSTLARSGVHVVRRGETLGGIARRYGISVARVQSMNGLRGTRVIAGQTLRVSGSASRTSSAKSRTSSRTTSAKASTAKKSSAKSSTAKKSTAKKSAAKKSTAKSSTAKKSSAKSSTARKSAPKKPAATKPAAGTKPRG
jgi:membrane-bound lytic murein transglycosylase D